MLAHFFYSFPFAGAGPIFLYMKTPNENETETFGFYEPGFLHLRINTDEDISDLNVLAADESKRRLFSTFLHEYIHFLQDLTTPCGLMNNFLNIDFIKAVNWSIRHDGKPEFVIPVKIDNEANVKANAELRRLYRGDNKEVQYLRYNHYAVEEETITDKDGTTYQAKMYRAFFHDSSYQLRSFYIGHACIKEFITHTLQKKYFPAVDHPDFPYVIVERIIEKEHPEFGNDAMMAVALCDACLMFTHPAQIFFTTLQRMTEQKFVPATIKDVYDFTFLDVEFKGPMGTFDFASLYDNVVVLAANQFADALQSPIFSDNLNWVMHLLVQASALREVRPHFMTELVAEEGKLSALFFRIVQILGTPFFTNRKWEGKLIPPQGITPPTQPYQLLVFQQIMNLYAGHTCCALYNFCKTQPDRDITNGHCLSAPWLRAKEDELCPFGQLWKTWGLIDEIPVRIRMV